jgi:putative transcriptional regulator
MIDPGTIDLASLPWLPLDERSAFPRQPAIYFAIASSGEVQYIGISKDPRQRWYQHHRYQQLEALGKIRIAYLFVEDATLLRPIEDALIAWFCPPLNMTSAPLNPTSIPLKATSISSRKPLAKGHIKRTRVYCRLAVLMAEKNPQLSQRQLARDTGLDITTINRLFTNNFTRVDKSTIEILCDYFDKNVGDLFQIRNLKDIPTRQSRKQRLS